MSEVIYIGQADHRASADPSVVMSTVLGSCVATCLYDPVAKVGGMNHFLLPDTDTDRPGELRFGLNLMETLINDLLKQNARKKDLVAKIFGGANVIMESSTIGARNGRFARQFLKDEGIPCIAESIGGDRARRIRFWPATGRAAQLILSPTDVRNDLLAVPRKRVVQPEDNEPEIW